MKVSEELYKKRYTKARAKKLSKALKGRKLTDKWKDNIRKSITARHARRMVMEEILWNRS